MSMKMDADQDRYGTAVEDRPPLQGAVAQNIRKGVLMFDGLREFTLSFDQRFLTTHRQEYLMFVELVKKLKQRRQRTTGFAWDIPVADDAVKTLTQFLAWGISPTKDAREKLAAELKRIAVVDGAAQSAEEAVTLDIPTAPALAAAMKNYQRAGVKMMVGFGRAYLADEMGLGKSLQALAAIELTQAFPALIICPSKLKRNWLAECRKWLPHRRASLLANDLAEITVLSYNEVHDYVQYQLYSPKAKEKKAAKAEIGKRKYFFPDIVRLKSVTTDECHFIKHSDSRRSQAATAIAELCACPIRFALSGTPVENGRPAELIAPMTYLGVMEKMGGWFHFARRYCGGRRTRFGFDTSGATNLLELHSEMRKNFYIRRKKKDVLKELPDKIEMVYEAEITNEPEYRRIERDVVAWMMEQSGGLVAKTKMDAKHLIKMNALRQAAGVGKVGWIVEWIDTFLESGEKFVIYAHHAAVLDALISGLRQWNPAVILGGCDDEDVARQEKKFMTDEKCRLFIGSTLAAGFGLTLTAASSIGIAELMWTHDKHKQVADRVHRIGQRDCVNVYYFIAPGTIDEDLWSLVSEKARNTASTADGESVVQANLLQNLARKLLRAA